MEELLTVESSLQPPLYALWLPFMSVAEVTSVTETVCTTNKKKSIYGVTL